MKQRKIMTKISAGCLLSLLLFAQASLASFAVAEEEYPTYGNAQSEIFRETVEGSSPVTPDDEAFLRSVDRREPKRSGYYIKGGVGTASTSVGGIENNSVPVVMPSGKVNLDLNNNTSRFEDDLKQLIAAFGYKGKSWGAEFEMAFSKVLFFGYDPLLPEDPAFISSTAAACDIGAPGPAAPTIAEVPATKLRASMSVKEITGLFNFMYFFPHFKFQPHGLDFYALLGLGFAYMDAKTQTNAKEDDVAPFPSSKSSPANQPLKKGQTREIKGTSATNIAGQFGAGVRYAVINRLFLDLSIRRAEHGSLRFGPVEGKSDATTFNDITAGCNETIPNFEGIKFRSRKVANTSIFFSAGMPLG